MNHTDYTRESERTLSTMFFVEDVEVQKLLHGAIGIVTELGELSVAIENSDNVNIGEECADVFWYIAIFDRYYGTQREETIEEVALDSKFFLKATEVLDVFKKKAFYNKPINDQLVVGHIDFIYRSIVTLCNSLDINVQEIKQKNIMKLRVRFPEKFTTELANNRNLSEERATLEA